MNSPEGYATFLLRMLIFTPSSVKTVRVFINGRLVDGTPVHAGGPLYVLPWQPEKFSSGQHHLAVSAEVCQYIVSTYSHCVHVQSLCPRTVIVSMYSHCVHVQSLCPCTVIVSMYSQGNSDDISVTLFRTLRGVSLQSATPFQSMVVLVPWNSSPISSCLVI